MDCAPHAHCQIIREKHFSHNFWHDTILWHHTCTPLKIKCAFQIQMPF